MILDKIKLVKMKYNMPMSIYLMLFYPFDLFLFISNNIAFVPKSEFIANILQQIFFGKYFQYISAGFIESRKV